MLTFFATLLVNILVGTVFYLVISLKLEKSASELHVKKIRREMDEMIKEFNLTAERNISLLENRIDMMKRLLERNGIPVDFEVTSSERYSNIGDHEMVKSGSSIESEIVKGKGILGKLGNQLRSAIGDASIIHESDMKKVSKTKKDPEQHHSPRKKMEQSPIVRSDDAIRKKFAAASDRAKRYELINELVEDGYPVEAISRLSGIPAGEISLVIQLGTQR
jgi:hypothetical protein